MKNLTIVIKTFNRKASLWRLLNSISKYYSQLPIIIVDDSKKNYKDLTEYKFKHLDLTYIVTTFDIGLSKGRNILIENVKTDYFLLCDDDFEFDERTNLEKAFKLLIDNNVDIIGGLIYNIFKIDTIYSLLWVLKKPSRILDVINSNEMISVYNGKYKIVENDVELKIDKDYRNYMDKEIYDTDIISNFFIANTEKIKEIRGWQPEEIKVGEHQAFFFRCKQNNLKVCFTPCFGVKHYPKKSILYNKYRMRSYRMIKESFEILKLNSYRTIDVEGNELFLFESDKKINNI